MSVTDSVSIVMPARNEAVNLRRFLPELRAMFPAAEIIVVNDGSTDDTVAVCEANNVKAVSHQYSKGNGASIKTGARNATGDVLVFMVPTVDKDGLIHRSEVRLADYARVLDGLVLQGGADVSPSSYGETPLDLQWAGDRLRDVGGEFGTTTGRPRRCGWFDAVIARYATRVNGLTDFFLTKLDVLTGWEQIPVCVAYEIDGRRVEELPYNQSDFHHAKPVYEMLPGWSEDLSKAQTFGDLPKNAQAYVKALEEMSGAPISAIGVGPGRTQTVVVRDLV